MSKSDSEASGNEGKGVTRNLAQNEQTTSSGRREADAKQMLVRTRKKKQASKNVIRPRKRDEETTNATSIEPARQVYAERAV